MKAIKFVPLLLWMLVAYLLWGCEAYAECKVGDGEPGMYSRVSRPTLDNHHLQDLPGFTRSVLSPDHALLTPESRVWSPLPGWKNALAAVVITPAIGAHFTMTLVNMAGNSSAGLPLPGHERLLFVVEGEVEVLERGHNLKLPVNHFFYAPSDHEHRVTSQGAFLVMIDRKYSSPPSGVTAKPQFRHGDAEKQATLETPGEVFVLRKLLPTSLEYDFNIHIMDFSPGEYLNVKELHYNQHGLLLLQGKGIYRLADKWYPVQAGDVIWMAPYVTQWYAALGSSKSRYFLYKDTNRDPILQY